jgi:transcriptional regulator with PAS, ATPase and Fis domain
MFYMATLTPNLFDAEFFGYTKGAFTGAEKDRTGYLEHTNNGTLFLDEIGILPMALQGKLLRVLQSGEFIKIGSNKPQKTDIRLIASTNEDLEKLIQQKKFRKDLFYRLNGAWLNLPPLKERKEDIYILIQAFIREFLNQTNNCQIDDTVFAQLAQYDFPGNIRELRSIIQAAVNLAHGGSITVSHLPEKFRKIKSPGNRKGPPQLDELLTLAEAEKQLILKTYEYTSGNKSQTAKILDVAINTVRKKLESYGVK